MPLPRDRPAGYGRAMNAIPALPTSPLAVRTVEYVRACETEPVANHSFRSYLFAALLAEHDGLRPTVDFDPDLLFFACTLHDLGTSSRAGGAQRFEVDGADMAAAFLTDNGVERRDVDLVWEAIALHSSPGIAERRGALSYLTRRGVTLDFGPGSEFVTDDQARAIHDRYPRLRMVTSLVDEIVRHAGRGPQNAPRFTIAGELARERGRDGQLTSLEQAALTSRWGE